MSRTPSLALSTTLMISPGGWALPNDPGSVWGGFLTPMATAWSGIEVAMEKFQSEIDPRSSVALLPQWQQLLGADPCGRDLLALSQSDQQRLAYQRYTARGGQSIPYYISLAASMGVTITITEGAWARAGQLRAGGRLSAPGNEFNWQVTLPASRVTLFRAGGAKAGNRLGDFTPNLVQCAIAKAAPAHTIVTFNYSGTGTV